MLPSLLGILMLAVTGSSILFVILSRGNRARRLTDQPEDSLGGHELPRAGWQPRRRAAVPKDARRLPSVEDDQPEDAVTAPPEGDEATGQKKSNASCGNAKAIEIARKLDLDWM